MTSGLFQNFNHSQLYAKFRPFPPKSFIYSILDFLKKKIDPPFETAVDIGCGTGQSTVVLSPHFQKVLGLDISTTQIQLAQMENSSQNIEYCVSTGESFNIPSSTVQLVTISQAVHWFNTRELFKEIQRILVPNGVISTYGYWIPLPKTNDEIKNDQIEKLIIKYLYNEKLGSYWHPRRSVLEDRYINMDFPFKDRERLNLVEKMKSDLPSYIGYLSSWSAFQKYLKEDENKAKQLLQEIQNRLIQILNEKRPFEEISLDLHTEFFMNMGRK